MSKSASRYLQRAARVSAGMYRIGGYKFKHISKKKKKRLKIIRTINHPTKKQPVESFNVPKFKKAKSAIPSCGYEARLVDGKYILCKDGVEHAQIVAKP